MKQTSSVNPEARHKDNRKTGTGRVQVRIRVWQWEVGAAFQWVQSLSHTGWASSGHPGTTLPTAIPYRHLMFVTRVGLVLNIPTMVRKKKILGQTYTSILFPN